MSDSSSEEDLSRFREVVDTSFTKLIYESRGQPTTQATLTNTQEKPIKSERYLDESSHYSDVKVPEEMQRRIGSKVSAIIQKNIVFVDMECDKPKKHKIRGGVKLFKASDGYLSCKEVKDTFTENHNMNAKRLKKQRRHIDADNQSCSEDDKVKAAAVSGEHVLSKIETKHWKSRRKEKLFKYKSQKKSKVLLPVE